MRMVEYRKVSQMSPIYQDIAVLLDNKGHFCKVKNYLEQFLSKKKEIWKKMTFDNQRT